MACKNPMWRIPWDKCRIYLPDEYERRVHNGGIRINRAEYEYLCTKRPIFKQFIQENPCGQCAECRLAKSRDWANRCMLEAKQFKDNVFVTLTYDDNHLKFGQYIDPETGETDLRATVLKKDFQDFMKRLRRYFEYHYGFTGIRYFACGEYGEQFERPHYHAILFNCTFPDLKIEGESVPGGDVPFYGSKILDEIWQNGHCVIGNVDWETCAYTARYVMKKQTGKAVTLRNKLQKVMQEEAKTAPLQPKIIFLSSRNLIYRNLPLQAVDQA